MDKNITRIALVDDHALLRNGLASLIQTFEGYSVLFEADNGRNLYSNYKRMLFLILSCLISLLIV